MKKILLSLFILASFTAFAQQNSSIVVVDGFIASSSFIKANKSNIKSQKIYNAGVALPKSLTEIGKSAKNGIVSVNFKAANYDRISFASLNEQFQLSSENPVVVDGKWFNDTKIEILGDVLQNMEVKTIDGKQVLSISFETKS